jgi:hypothetical protein
VRIVPARGLAGTPLDAAAEFHARIVPVVREAIAGTEAVCIVFDPADHAHRAWRVAAVQALAREAAPARINAVAAADNATCASTLAYLEQAPGVTGQYFQLDGHGAGDPVG